MPDWSASPVVAAAVGAFAATAGSAITALISGRRDRAAATGQATIESAKRLDDKAERRLDSRRTALIQLVAELRLQLQNLEEFVDYEGVAPGNPMDRLPLLVVQEKLTAVLLLCPDEVAVAADAAADAMVRAVNREGTLSTARDAIKTLIEQARSLLT